MGDGGRWSLPDVVWEVGVTDGMRRAASCEFPTILSLNRQRWMHISRLVSTQGGKEKKVRSTWENNIMHTSSSQWVSESNKAPRTGCYFAPLTFHNYLTFDLWPTSSSPLCGPPKTNMPSCLHGLYLSPDSGKGKVMCSWLVSGRRRKEREKWEQRVGWGWGWGEQALLGLLPGDEWDIVIETHTIHPLCSARLISYTGSYCNAVRYAMDEQSVRGPSPVLFDKHLHVSVSRRAGWPQGLRWATWGGAPEGTTSVVSSWQTESSTTEVISWVSYGSSTAPLNQITANEH